jgi:sodium-dependent dicarboxylate transporter 2/3/5
VIATGYCLTLTVSAKSLIVFSGAAGTAFAQRDLLRLSAILLPVHLVLLIVFSIYIWPLLGLPLQPPASAVGG